MTRWNRRYYRPRRAPSYRGEPEWLDPDAPDGDFGDADLPGADEPEFMPPQALLPPPRILPSPNVPGWKNAVDRIAADLRRPGVTWPANRELHYIFSVPDTNVLGALVLDVGCRARKRNGEWRQLTTFQLSAAEIERVPDPSDRHILSTLSGSGWYGRTTSPGFPCIRYYVPSPLLHSLLPIIAGTGRATLRATAGEKEPSAPLVWDDGAPWQFRLEVRAAAPRNYEVTGALCRGDERVDLATPALLHAGGAVFFADRIARLDVAEAFPWIMHLRRVEKLRVPASQTDRFLGELLRMPVVPSLDLPSELAYETVRPEARPRLRVRRREDGWAPDQVVAELTFDYGGEVIAAASADHGVLQADPRRLIFRSPDAERAARERLLAQGFRERALYSPEGGQRLMLPARNLPRVARALIDEGWHVEADGSVYRAPGRFHLSTAGRARHPGRRSPAIPAHPGRTARCAARHAAGERRRRALRAGP